MLTVIAAVDLAPVTDGITDLKTAVLAGAAIAVAAGVAIMAVKFGGKKVVQIFKSMSS